MWHFWSFTVKSAIWRLFTVRAKPPSPIHYWKLACEPTPSLTVRKWPNSSLHVSLCSSQLLCCRLPRFSLCVKVRLHIPTPVFTRLSLLGAILLDSSNTSQRVWRSRNQSCSDKTDVQPWHMLNHRIRRNDCDDPVEYGWACNPQQQHCRIKALTAGSSKYKRHPLMSIDAPREYTSGCLFSYLHVDRCTAFSSVHTAVAFGIHTPLDISIQFNRLISVTSPLQPSDWK